MEKTWLKHYDPRVSAEIDAERYASVVDIFEQSVKKFKDKEAFINMGHSITFEELDTLSAQFAAYLQASGLKRGDAVAIMMPNLLQYPVAMFGILRAGMVVVNVMPPSSARILVSENKWVKKSCVFTARGMTRIFPASICLISKTEFTISNNLSPLCVTCDKGVVKDSGNLSFCASPSSSRLNVLIAFSGVLISWLT